MQSIAPFAQTTFQAPLNAATHTPAAPLIHVASIPLAGLRNLAFPTGHTGPNEWVAKRNDCAYVISINHIDNMRGTGLQDGRQSIRSCDSSTWPLGDADDARFLKAPAEHGSLGRQSIRSCDSSTWPLGDDDDAQCLKAPAQTDAAPTPPQGNWPLRPAAVFTLRQAQPF